jgi:short-subunit dehydrogenase
VATSFEQKRVLLTGASSGIGRELAKWLVQQGALVWAAARREDALSSLRDELGSAKGQLEPLRLDVANTRATVAAIREVDERCGGLDVVIANAGVGEDSPAKSLDWDRVEHLLQVNVLGAAATVSAVLPAMVKRNRGHLVGISSLAALIPMRRMAAYAASKTFLLRYLECLRLDLEPTAVRVTAVLPGYVKSEMTAKNKFHMPFLLEADDAARRIGKAIARGEETFAFPLPVAAGARTAALVPDKVRRLAGSLGRRRGRGA